MKTPWRSLSNNSLIKKARSLFQPGPDLRYSAEIFKKANAANSFYANRVSSNFEKYQRPDIDLQNKINEIKEQEAQERRRAIATVSPYQNTFGVYREGFNRYDNDRLALHPIYGLCEKTIQDYVSTLEWTVKNKDKNEVIDAIDFLENPNKQDTLPDLMSSVCRDVTRYDQGIWVKTLNRRQKPELIDFKTYYGPEFWIEIDRQLQEEQTESGQKLSGYWSHGYVERYWQHSRQGLFLPFLPDEISYFRMYPRSDTPYGTDFLMHLRWYLETLLDSTKAAGMMFANGVNPGTVWKHPDLTSTQELRERMTEIELALQGAENYGGILHLINGEEFQQLTPTMVDMQWLQGQKWLSEIVWAMFGFSPADFGSGDMNRATAYIQTNVTKSRMLFPLITLFETRINRDILPFLSGYEKGWKFEFIPSVSLDDDQKRAGIKQTRSGTFATLLQAGVPADIAAKYSEMTDDLSPGDIKRLNESKQQNPFEQMMQGGFGPDEGGMEGEPEEYSGTDDFNDDYSVRKAIRKGKPNGQQRLDIFLHVDSGDDTIKKSRGFYQHKGRPGKVGGSIKRGDNVISSSSSIGMNDLHQQRIASLKVLQDAEGDDYDAAIEKDNLLRDRMESIRDDISDLIVSVERHKDFNREYLSRFSDNGVEGQLKRRLTQMRDLYDEYEATETELEEGEEEPIDVDSPEWRRWTADVKKLEKKHNKLSNQLDSVEEKIYTLLARIVEFED